MKHLIRINLANAVSIAALLFAWLAIIFLLRDKFYFSLGLALLAFVFDALDGYLARWLKINNPLGKALDGYIDVVNYLIYPALAFYIFFRIANLLSMIAIFSFLAAGVYRLARFEVRGIKTANGKMYYEGLPVFFSPILILMFLLVSKIVSNTLFAVFATITLFIVSFSMIQTFKFPKPKNILPVIIGALILSLIFLASGS